MNECETNVTKTVSSHRGQTIWLWHSLGNMCKIVCIAGEMYSTTCRMG